jgi:hypothetical protein
MEDGGIIFGKLVYFTVMWYILWPFDKFNCYLEYFSRFGILQQEKSGIPNL